MIVVGAGDILGPTLAPATVDDTLDTDDARDGCRPGGLFATGVVEVAKGTASLNVDDEDDDDVVDNGDN